MRIGLLVVLWGLALVASVSAQGTPPINPTNAGAVVVGHPFLNREFFLVLVVVGFGVIVMLFQYLLLRPVVENKTEDIAKTFIVTLIIIGTLAILAAGYDSSQIAPALGLFGTIAGYLLGKSERKADGKE